MAKRRRVIVGLGTLVFGSGAISTQAGFGGNSVSPASDMRVVVEDNLLVEAGASFRDGTGSYDTSINAGPSSKFEAASSFSMFDVSSPSGGGNDGLDAISADDSPAAYVSNDTNGDLTIKIAVPNEQSTTFADLLRVTNNTDSSKDIGVNFATFGADTKGPQDSQGGDVDEENVVAAYKFEDDSSNRISTDPGDYNSNKPSQAIPTGNAYTIPSGATKQISLVIDATSSGGYSGADIASQIDTAADTSSGGNPFAGEVDTVQLVDTISIGTSPDEA